LLVIKNYNKTVDAVGGVPKPSKKSEGGPIERAGYGGLLEAGQVIKRFARGGFHGLLPGYGGGDRRLILAEDGEYVIRKEAVSKYGAGLFEALNTLRMPTVRLDAEARRLLTLEAPVRQFGGGGQVVEKRDGTLRFEFKLNEREVAANPTIKHLARQLADELHRQSRRV
jgi:hypothetical protein